MIKYVQKRELKNKKPQIVDFDISKIAIAVSKAFIEVRNKNTLANESELERLKKEDEKAIELIANRVKRALNKLDKDIVHVEEIQDIVEKELIKANYADVAKAYILYRNERTRRREYKNRLMQEIETITFADAKDADIKRDNANVDGNTPMGTMLQYGSAISKEFCKTYVIHPEHSYAHERGDIHIHDMDFLNMGTLTCCQIELDKLFNGGFSTGHGYLREPNDIISYSALTAIAIQANQNDEHGGQSIPLFDYYLAKGVLKTFRKKLKDNLYKHMAITFESEFEAIEDATIQILESYGEIRSIEFNEDEKQKLIDIISDVINKYFKECDDNILIAKKIVNFALPHSLKETDKQTFQAMEALIHNLNTMHSRAGAQVPFSSINFGTDTSPEGRMVSKNLLLAQERGLGKQETAIFPITIFKVKKGINYNPEDPNYDLFKLAIRVSAKRLFPNFCFLDAPFNAQYYVPGKPETEVTYMGCRTRVMGNVCGDEVATGRGNISFTTINLPRLGILHGIADGSREIPDMEGFYKDLDSKIELVIQQLLERFEIQGCKRVYNFPFLMGQGIWRGSEKLKPTDMLKEVIKQGSLTVGFIGLAETLKALIGEHHGESEKAQKLGLEIITHMRKRVDEATKKYNLNFALIATPAEGLSGRFTRIDKKIFGEIPGVTDKAYYTNSFHVPVYYQISAFKKIQIEAPYHALTNGGHISYVELNGDTTKNLEAFESIIRCMAESGIGYGSINHPVDRDPICGFSGVIGDICPSCGRKEDEVKFERIRRITGYLVGTLDRFNNSKAQEEKDRVKHSI